jgi:hypothetical protein
MEARSHLAGPDPSGEAAHQTLLIYFGVPVAARQEKKRFLFQL